MVDQSLNWGIPTKLILLGWKKENRRPGKGGWSGAAEVCLFRGCRLATWATRHSVLFSASAWTNGT